MRTRRYGCSDGGITLDAPSAGVPIPGPNGAFTAGGYAVSIRPAAATIPYAPCARMHGPDR